MQKIILKTALKSLLGVIIALILAFGIASFGFPKSMAGICADCGNYRFATSYASLRYTYTKSVDDLDVCAQYSIFSGHDGNIVKFCGKLVDDKGFEGICEKRGDKSGDYKQFIYGNLCAAQYRRGDKQKAVDTAETAMEGVNGFPAGNAFVSLTLEVQKKSDKETATAILEIIEGNFEQTKTYEAVIAILQEITA